MRLRNAKTMDEYEDDAVSGFGDREARLERRDARRDRRKDKRSARKEQRVDRRDARKEKRQERRVERVERRQDNVREKLSRVPGPPPPASRYAAPASSSVPTLQPAPSTWPPPEAPKRKKKMGEWLESAVDQVVEVFDDGQLDPEELEEELEDEVEATEGVGAWSPLRRRPAAAREPAWGPAVRMGRKLRIQAAVGHRAAVIDLKPGLYLVAELPEGVTRTEFGLAPLLAPLMMNAARRAMDEPPRERRGPLASLFRRRREEPIRYVQVVAQPAPAQAPLALPGPVQEPTAMVVPAPDVGWADDASVAAAYGCDACERNRR